MSFSRERQGELFIFAEATLWALFPVITILSYNTLSPLISLGTSTLFAAIFFALVLTIKKNWHEVKNISALKDILVATFFLGIMYYLFYFFGLHFTSAGNASIVALTEVFFSYLFFNVWRKDHLPMQHLMGAILMVIGALVVLYPNVHAFQIGDLLVLAAAFIAPFGNFFQRRARTIVSSETIMFTRSIISAAVIFLLATVFHTTFSYVAIKGSLVFLLINGVMLLGLSKVLWVEGIHRISVVKSNALSSLSPLLTLLFALILLKNSPTTWQLLSFIPMFFGVLLLGISKKKNHD